MEERRNIQGASREECPHLSRKQNTIAFLDVLILEILAVGFDPAMSVVKEIVAKLKYQKELFRWASNNTFFFIFSAFGTV